MLIAVDFDETIATTDMLGLIEVPIAIASLAKLRSAGHTLMLFTNRTGATLAAALAWLDEKGFKFDSVNGDLSWWERLFISASKPYADKFIDDRNVGCPLLDYSGTKVVNWVEVLKALP